jgi:phospholipid transport system substrate-binding protein
LPWTHRGILKDFEASAVILRPGLALALEGDPKGGFMLKLLGSPIVGMLWVGLLASPAIAISPTEQIQGTVQQVIKVVGNPAQSEDRRKELLRETLMSRFDWLEMSKQALGRYWSDASGREHEFVSAFAEFLGNAYIGQIGSYRNEKVLYIEESIEKSRAQVKTRIVPEKGDAISINYRLHRIDSEWKIYDVVVDEISIIGNYRSQFGRILAKGTFDDLVRQLKEREYRK